MRTLSILFCYGRNDGHAAVATFTAQPPKKATSQHRRIDPIRFCAPVLARDGHTGGMDHLRINAAIPQPTGQPKAIAPGLICDGNPGDLLPSLDGFVTPAIQQPQQHLWIRSNFLQRFAIDARNHPGDQPTRQAHFNCGYDRVILNEGGEARFAIVVALLHRGAPVNLPIDRSDELRCFAACPIASYIRSGSSPHQGPSCNSEGGKGGSKTDGIHLDGGVFQPCSFTITHPPWNRYVPLLAPQGLAQRLEVFSLAPVGTIPVST